MRSTPLLIDTGAIELLWDRKTFSVLWQYFDKNIRHCINPIIEWEFLRQFGHGEYSESKRKFTDWVSARRLQVLPFDSTDSRLATEIYLGVSQKLAQLERKKDNKIRLNGLTGDMLIAASAVRYGFPVLTRDLEDWTLLSQIIKSNRIGLFGALHIIDGNNPIDS